MRGEGVAAHDVQDHDLRPPPVALDPGLAGITSGGDLGRVQFEILFADPGPAPDDRALPHLGGEDAQHQREPPGSCVHPGLEADPDHRSIEDIEDIENSAVLSGHFEDSMTDDPSKPIEDPL